MSRLSMKRISSCYLCPLKDVPPWFLTKSNFRKKRTKRTFLQFEIWYVPKIDGFLISHILEQVYPVQSYGIYFWLSWLLIILQVRFKKTFRLEGSSMLLAHPQYLHFLVNYTANFRGLEPTKGIKVKLGYYKEVEPSVTLQKKPIHKCHKDMFY